MLAAHVFAPGQIQEITPGELLNEVLPLCWGIWQEVSEFTCHLTVFIVVYWRVCCKSLPYLASFSESPRHGAAAATMREAPSSMEWLEIGREQQPRWVLWFSQARQKSQQKNMAQKRRSSLLLKAFFLIYFSERPFVHNSVCSQFLEGLSAILAECSQFCLRSFLIEIQEEIHHFSGWEGGGYLAQRLWTKLLWTNWRFLISRVLFICLPLYVGGLGFLAYFRTKDFVLSCLFGYMPLNQKKSASAQILPLVNHTVILSNSKARGENVA